MDTFILDGFWGGHARWERLRRVLAEEVGPAHVWRYDNSGRRPIAELAAVLVEELRRRNGSFHLVGYSMGGLVAREAMRLAPDLALSRAVFLHSPHEGTVVSHLLPLPACRDMRPGSPFLRRLNAAPWRYPTLVTWCTADLMVVPGSSARWVQATEVHRSRMPAHVWPVFSSGIHRRVAAFLGGA